MAGSIRLKAGLGLEDGRSTDDDQQDFLTTVIASFLLVLSACVSRADSFTLGFSAGSASADAGGEIQFGYSFANPNPSWWAVVSNISAELPPSSLVDSPQFPQSRLVVNPLSTLSSPTGLIDFSWASDAPGGYSFSGLATAQVLWLRFQLGTLFTRFYSQVSRNETASYEAGVSGTAPSAVPEPGTLGLAAVGLLALGTLIRKTTGT